MGEGSAPPMVAEDEHEECRVEVGGVWRIACVQQKGIPVHNRFEELMSKDEDNVKVLPNSLHPIGSASVQDVDNKSWPLDRAVS